MMAGKPVHEVPSHTSVGWSSAFAHKRLCSGPVMNLGDACVYKCRYCYVPSMNYKRVYRLLDALGSDFQDVVIRRTGYKTGQTALDTLKKQLSRGTLAKRAHDEHVCFTSSTVDPAPNAILLEETAQAIAMIMRMTRWDVRVLSKSANLPRLAHRIVELMPGSEGRVIFGVSTGTLNNALARAMEVGTPLVSSRIASLRQLQDEGFRTFGMICPSLPQTDYDAFSASACEAIRVERCEHVWAEPMNVRGDSTVKTIGALEGAGFNEEAAALRAVTGKGKKAAWDDYAKATFLAHARHIPAQKLRFLHYPTKTSLPWWKTQRTNGAVLLGALVGH